MNGYKTFAEKFSYMHTNQTLAKNFVEVKFFGFLK